MSELLLSGLLAWQTQTSQISRASHYAHQAFVNRTYLSPTQIESRPAQKRAEASVLQKISLSSRQPKIRRPLAALPQKRKVLIIAPHPDDEIICCADLIGERVKAGETVKVIYLTDGDALNKHNPSQSRSYGQRRRQESIAAMRHLGITRSQLTFLNFPDGSLHKLGLGPYQSPYTHQNKSLTATHFNHTPYTQKALKKNIERLITQFTPDEIYLPSSTEDHHPDHVRAAEIVLDILEEQENFTPKTFEYVVHNEALQNYLSEVNLPKLKLLRLFVSQFHDDHHRLFMENFARIPEAFTPWERSLVKSE